MSGSIEEVLGAVGGVAFIVAFVLGAALGLSLIRRPELRPAAVCLSAIAALIPLTILMAFSNPRGDTSPTQRQRCTSASPYSPGNLDPTR